MNVTGNFPPNVLDLIKKGRRYTFNDRSVRSPRGQRSHRIVLQCRCGRFSMTNIISQAVSAALYRVPADSHRSARTIVRPSTLAVARNRARFPSTKVQCFTLSRLKLRQQKNLYAWCSRSNYPFNVFLFITFYFFFFFFEREIIRKTFAFFHKFFVMFDRRFGLFFLIRANHLGDINARGPDL